VALKFEFIEASQSYHDGRDFKTAYVAERICDSE
jgi:hypothetical protein